MSHQVITVRGREHRSAPEALRCVRAHGANAWCAILVAGKCLSVPRAEAERVAAAGIEIAYLVDHQGKIMTIPAGGR